MVKGGGVVNIILQSRLELDPEGLNINEKFNISAKPVEEF